MNKIKNNRVIYDNDYYILQAIILSEKYSLFINDIKRKLENVGFPIPDGGFKNTKEFLKWQDEIIKTPYHHYVGFFDELLENFNITQQSLNLNYDKLFQGLKFNFFYGKKEFLPKPTIGGPRFNLDDNNKPISIRLSVFANATKEDYINAWEHISMLQRDLKDYKKDQGKKERNTKKRDPKHDIQIYLLYKKVKQNIKNGIINPNIKTNTRNIISKNVIDQMRGYDEFKKILKESKTIVFIDDQIKEIWKVYNKYLKNINFL